MYNENFLIDHRGKGQPAEDLLQQLEDLLAMELREQRPTPFQSVDLKNAVLNPVKRLVVKYTSPFCAPEEISVFCLSAGIVYG